MPHETGIPTPELSYLRDAPIRCMPLLPASVPHMCTFLPLPGPTFCPQARSEKNLLLASLEYTEKKVDEKYRKNIATMEQSLKQMKE